jgi:hypothetical protein
MDKQNSSEEDEEVLEKAYQTIDKKQIDKKMYLGKGSDRRVWDGHEPLTINTDAWTTPTR